MKRLMSMEGVGPALRSVISRVKDATTKRSSVLPNIAPRLVAVSKLKPAECIVVSYQHGQRHFGENYVQELLEKSADPQIKELKEIRWHFIGHLQSNKCNNLVGVPNLFMVETVDSQKLASTLNASWGKQDRPSPLNIMVQVNTSDEASKKGCAVDQCVEMVVHILSHCPHLKFAGLMTIGEMNYDWGQGPNPDFICLAQCREEVCKKLGLNVEDVELSMGMSSDFDKAILMGSTNVRVGSTIYGARQPRPPAASSPTQESGETKSHQFKETTTSILQDNVIGQQIENLAISTPGNENPVSRDQDVEYSRAT